MVVAFHFALYYNYLLLPVSKLLANEMILGPISLVDCAAFVFFLIPQLLYQAGLGATLLTVVKVVPFLGMHTPLHGK